MESGRIGCYRHSGTYLYDGLPKRGNYRFRTGVDGCRLVSHSVAVRYNLAAYFVGGIHRGDGYAGR